MSVQSFDVEEIRGELPNTLTDAQQQMLVCAIRNPDAGMSDIGERTNKSHGAVRHALMKLVQGYDKHGTDSTPYSSLRGTLRTADTWTELTDKQKAIVDWLARNYDVLDTEELTISVGGAKVAEGINQSERYDLSVSSSYPVTFLSDYADIVIELIEERREVLAARQELDDRSQAELRDSFDQHTVREYLTMAGLGEILPDENLDSLPDRYASRAADADEGEGTTDTPDDGTDAPDTPVAPSQAHGRRTEDGDLHCVWCDAGPFASYEAIHGHLAFCDAYTGGTPDDDEQTDDTDDDLRVASVDELNERLANIFSRMENIEDRMRGLEDVVSQANYQRELIRARLRELEAAEDETDANDARERGEFARSHAIIDDLDADGYEIDQLDYRIRSGGDVVQLKIYAERAPET